MPKVRPKIILTVLILIVAIFSTLLLPWEPSTETWGYWVFSRILVETGRFIVPDRSPLYTLYLIPFHIFNYPYSVYLETVITTFLCVAAFIGFLKKYIGLPLAIIGTLVWLPFIVISEPSVQKLALACVSLALYIRETYKSRFVNALFYTLLLFAYFFRLTYGPVIFFFVAYDLYKQIRKSHGRMSTLFRVSIKTDWPLLIPIALYLSFVLFQSPHPWNATTFSSTQWFPSAKKIPMTYFLNQIYIQENYYSLEKPDIYFSNKLLFGDAQTIVGALRVNSHFILSHVGQNLLGFLSIFSGLTVIQPWLSQFPNSNLFHVMLFIMISYGALMAVPKTTKIYFIAIICTLLLGFTISLTSPRYLFSLIPIYIISMWWYGKTFINLLLFLLPANKFIAHVRRVSTVVLTGLLFIVSGNGEAAHYWNASLGWSGIINSLVALPEKHTITLLTSTSTDPTAISMHTSFSVLEKLSQQCHGIMTMEYPFIGAFMHIPLSYVYDIWEIPPFGSYGDRTYTDLRPDRINCLFVSRGLSMGEGKPTNNRIRYLSYIKPYEDVLMSQKARRYTIPSYGYAVILPETN